MPNLNQYKINFQSDQTKAKNQKKIFIKVRKCTVCSKKFCSKVLFTDGFKGKNFVYEFCVLCILVNRLYTVIHNTQNS